MVTAKIVVPSSEGKFVAFVPPMLISKFLSDFCGLKTDELVGATIEFIHFTTE